MSAPECVILGAGGHARVVIECLRASGAGVPRAILDPDSKRWGSGLDDVPIAGGDSALPEIRQRGIIYFVVGVGGVGDNRPREQLFNLGLSHGFEPLTLIHPRAVVSQRTSIGAGVQIFANTVVNVGAALGANVIVNTGAIVEHDCLLGAHVHVASGACLGGAVCVRERAHIGAGSVVRQCIEIGCDALVGAGAAVVKNVAPGAVVAGVPAKPLSRL